MAAPRLVAAAAAFLASAPWVAAAAADDAAVRDGDAVLALDALDLAAAAPELGQAAVDDPDALSAAFTAALAGRGVARAFVRPRGVPLPAAPADAAALRAAPACVFGVVTAATPPAACAYSRTLACAAECGASAVDAPGARAVAPCACGAGAVVDAVTYADCATAWVAAAPCVGGGGPRSRRLVGAVRVAAVGGDLVAALTPGALVVVAGVASLEPGGAGRSGWDLVLRASSVTAVVAPPPTPGLAPPALFLDAALAASRSAVGRAPSSIALAALLLSASAPGGGGGRGLHIGVVGAPVKTLAAFARAVAPVATVVPSDGLPLLPSGDAAGALVAARCGVCVVDARASGAKALAAALDAADAGVATVRGGGGSAPRRLAAGVSVWVVDPPTARRGVTAAVAAAAATVLDVVVAWTDDTGAAAADDAVDDVLAGPPPPPAALAVAALAARVAAAAAAPPPPLSPVAAALLAAYHAAARAAGGAPGGGRPPTRLARVAAASARLHGRVAAGARDAALAAALTDAAAPAGVKVLPPVATLGGSFGEAVAGVESALRVLAGRAGGANKVGRAGRAEE